MIAINYSNKILIFFEEVISYLETRLSMLYGHNMVSVEHQPALFFRSIIFE
jgi:hypothetical protein